MAFKGITIDEYIKLHLKNNPAEDKAEMERRLKRALEDYQNGVKCSCGNDIWVIGSASVGNACYTCITGESKPVDVYELESVINKRENNKGQRHIDEIKPDEIHGFFDDEGYEVNFDLIRKPSLCLTCVYNDDPREEISCNMIRFDQKGEQDFKCATYKKINA